VAAPVAEAFFGGMTNVMLAEGVQNSKNGLEFTGLETTFMAHSVFFSCLFCIG
jgi:hypothetical protein